MNGTINAPATQHNRVSRINDSVGGCTGDITQHKSNSHKRNRLGNKLFTMPLPLAFFKTLPLLRVTAQIKVVHTFYQ